MNSSHLQTLNLAEFKKHFLNGKPIIDVRAPIEFLQGAIPGSVNGPILDDVERALIGTMYKQNGPDEALQLGYQIVSGRNKSDKVDFWKKFIHENPETILTCFRGGKRSQITQQFLSEQGISVRRIEGGYKSIRQFFIENLDRYSDQQKMILLTGCTGSAKTHLLKKAQSFYPCIDLEELAQHRGSAFGNLPTPQPAQADFENRLSGEIFKLIEKNEARAFLFEDESRLIGHRHLPDHFFNQLRQSKVILVKHSLQERIENIFLDYIQNVNLSESLFNYYENSLLRIQKRLGGLKSQEILKDIQDSKIAFLRGNELESNKVWIEKLLVNYYDPLYTSSFRKRDPEILFEGTHAEILDFLSQFEVSSDLRLKKN